MLSHIQIKKVAQYGCILDIVSAKSSLLVEKQMPAAKPGQNLDKKHKHKVSNFPVCAKKCGLRPENGNF